MSWSSLRLPNDPSSGHRSYSSYNGLSITDEKLETLEAQGTVPNIIHGNY